MKLNWGTRIAALYIAFVVMIVTLVAATFRSKPVLVAQDYYLRETKFQEQLDAARAVAALASKPQLERTGDSVRIRFPELFRNAEISGTVTFYCPSSEQADQVVPVRTETASITLPAPRHGKPYQVQLDWVANGTHYYYQIP